MGQRVGWPFTSHECLWGSRQLHPSLASRKGGAGSWQWPPHICSACRGALSELPPGPTPGPPIQLNFPVLGLLRGRLEWQGAVMTNREAAPQQRFAWGMFRLRFFVCISCLSSL